MANEKQIIYWNEVAGPKWIKIGDLMDERFAAITSQLETRAKVQPGEHVLDVGCGMGPTSLRFAGLVGPGGHVTGIDISKPMLDTARARGANFANLDFLQVDAQTHDFGAARFDVLVSRFGVMFFADPVAAFANMRRFLKPGGRVCFVCWAPLAQNEHWAMPLDIAVAALGAPAPKHARAPGPMAFADADYVVDVLSQAGFAHVAVTPCPVPILGKTLDEEAQVACFLGPSGALLDEKQADAPTREALRVQFTQALAAFEGPDGIKLPATVYAVSAENPG